MLITALSHVEIKAQEAPLGGLTTQIATTVSNANAFSNPPQLAQNPGRQSCLIEYLGAASTATGLVFFGPAAPTATTSAFHLVSGQFIACGSGDGTVDTNAVWLGSNNVGDLFVFKVK